jgi:hypothetical protein
MKLYDIFLFQISKKKLKLQILKAIKIVWFQVWIIISLFAWAFYSFTFIYIGLEKSCVCVFCCLLFIIIDDLLLFINQATFLN